MTYSEFKIARDMALYYKEKENIKHSFIFGNLQDIEKICTIEKESDFKSHYCSTDIFNIIFEFKSFPTVVGSNVQGMHPIIMTATKSIPKSIKSKFIFIPRNSVLVTMVEGDISLNLVITQDNYGKIIICDLDKRLSRKVKKLDINMHKDLIYNIRCYFEIISDMLKKDIVALVCDDDYIYFPMDHKDIVEVFKNRDSDGRRTPIVYGVDSFRRIYAKKTSVVKSHLRGIGEVFDRGRRYEIIVGYENKKRYAIQF